MKKDLYEDLIGEYDQEIDDFVNGRKSKLWMDSIYLQTYQNWMNMKIVVFTLSLMACRYMLYIPA